MQIERVLSDLTLEEKAALVAGTDFMYTNPVPRLGVPSLRMSDGPHGLRVQEGKGGDNGVTGSAPATAFPTAATVACGWNEENSRKIGVLIGKEAHKYGVHVVLGPGANIKRNPTAGRNFEYFSEDPLLAGKLAAAEIQGIQSENVGVSLKHFALINAENYRFLGDSVSDERAMREIYLKVFEIAVKEANPATLMCAYNKINGTYCSENKWLLRDVLRGEWGFSGLVMTDWGAMHGRVKSLQAGLDLEMPGDTAVCRREIVEGVRSGNLSMQDLDEAVKNVLVLVDRYAKKFADDCDFDLHDKVASDVAEDCAVLLKNDGVLPLEKGKKYFVAGDLFEKMRYQGAGSSMINPARLTSPKKAFDEKGVNYTFARGYAENAVATNTALLNEALTAAKPFETALVFAGLTDYVESEGCDREHMRLPENQLALIDGLQKAGKRVVVVLFGGSPVELPFAEKVSAILNMYLPGQSGGRACARLLFGEVSPSGRLAETWPMQYADVPFYENFAKGPVEVYKESIFVGYRYYTTYNKRVRYPFGYGLSYTSFAWSEMKVKAEGEEIAVTCRVKNAGERAGAEVVQLYVSAPKSSVLKPLRELRAFRKVYLEAGEEKEVVLTFKRDELKFFDLKSHTWRMEKGEYRIELCSDAETVRLFEGIELDGEEVSPYSERVLAAYTKGLENVTDEVFTEMSGKKIPTLPPQRPVRLDSRFTDLKCSFMGKILYRAVLGVADKTMKEAKKLPEGAERDNKIKGALFMRRILESNTLISMSMSAGLTFPYNFAEGFASLANGHIFKGIKCFCTKIKAPKLPKEKGGK